MKSYVISLTLLLTSITFTAPVMAQLQRPSQDFFERGRERVEEEIRILQTKPLEENLQESASEPILEVSPSLESLPNQQPEEIETPTEKPNEMNSNPHK